MNRALRILAAVALLGLSVLLAAIMGMRFTDGPVFVFPGGPLRSGEQVDYQDVDWGDHAAIREIEFQLESPARSRTTWFIVHEGKPYIPCGFCTNRLLKRWPRDLEADDRIVLRLDGVRIEGRARRVEDASPEFFGVAATSESKYHGVTQAGDVAEREAARTVSGAVDLAEEALGASDDGEPDYWLFRIDPR